MGQNSIVIKGAREHNLRDVNVCIPRDELVVITAGDPLSSPFTNSGYETATNVCMVAQAL